MGQRTWELRSDQFWPWLEMKYQQKAGCWFGSTNSSSSNARAEQRFVPRQELLEYLLLHLFRHIKHFPKFSIYVTLMQLRWPAKGVLSRMGGMLTFVFNLLCEDLGTGRSATLFQMTFLHNQPHSLSQVTHVMPWILLRYGPKPSSLQMELAAGTKAGHLKIGDVRSEHSPLLWMWESGSRCALATVMNSISISS